MAVEEPVIDGYVLLEMTGYYDDAVDHLPFSSYVYIIGEIKKKIEVALKDINLKLNGEIQV